MSQLESIPRDALDDKLTRIFDGKVVRKDLVRKIKVGANVPVFVLEFLLGKYCASSDEVAIQMGLQVVNETLANNYIRADEAMVAQSKVKEKRPQASVPRQGQGPARGLGLLGRGASTSATSSSISRPVRPRLRAPADRRHLGAGGHALRVRRGKQGQAPLLDRPAVADPDRQLRPGGIPHAAAAEFSADEWIDIVVRTMGYEPSAMDRRLKMLFLVRLIPLCERNFNMVELGPARHGQDLRGAGDLALRRAADRADDRRQHVRPHERQAEGHGVDLGRRRPSTRWPTSRRCPRRSSRRSRPIASRGQFQRGKEADTGDASIAMFGNTNQPIDVMVQTGHLFAPCPT